MGRTPERWNEDIIFSSDLSHYSTASRAALRGRLHRLAHGIYSGSDEDPATIVRRNWQAIVARKFPGAVIVDASARRGAPDEHGRLYVDHRRQRPLSLPGLSVSPRQGPGPMPGDASLPDGLYMSSRARGLLDNLGRNDSRRLTERAVGDWVADIMARQGEGALNAIRDDARVLASALGCEAAFARLDALISAMLSTGPSDEDMPPVLRAGAAGDGYDRERLARFEACLAELDRRAPMPLPDLPATVERRRELPFFEAYFSNYIEGTEFPLDEAVGIVFGHEVPADRPADAHDILATFEIVSDLTEMRRTPTDPEEFLASLRARHARLMAARPDKHPGMFETRRNSAGRTVFVEPALVKGTLHAGFDAGRGLADPFARALYMMFVVAEVHPFDDGNGRMARMMMNAELVAAAHVRIIIPTVFRGEYLSALRGATHNSTFGSLVAVLAFAQRYTAQIDFGSVDCAEVDLERTNAFVEPDEAEKSGVRLLLPSSLDRVG